MRQSVDSSFYSNFQQKNAGVPPCISYFLGVENQAEYRTKKSRKSGTASCKHFFPQALLSASTTFCGRFFPQALLSAGTAIYTHFCMRNKTKQTSNFLLKWAAKSIGTVAVRRLRLSDTGRNACQFCCLEFRSPSFFCLYSV